MADLYPPSYPPRQQQPQPYHPRDSQSYQLNQHQSLSYPTIMSSHQNNHHQQPQQPPQQTQPTSASLSPDDEHPPKLPDQSTTPKPDQSGHSKPQATFLTKLYALVVSILLLSPTSSSIQSSRASRKPSYDSLGSSRRIHHRRKARAARPSRPSFRLSSVPLRKLLPTTQRASSS